MTAKQLDEIKQLIEMNNSSTIGINKTKLEFSKQIYKFSEKLVICTAIFTMYMIWETKDLSPLMYFIPAVFAEFSTATAFYYWKSKAENIAKYAKNGIIINENIEENHIERGDV